ncbi:PAS domain-containing protein/anti-sigma regulatory factor (Ser/Thr protein kinase) [Thermocatellispora tengchongensis]|uniref:protein-serine/threonine phosphatase n=3 Tax=Thermocatellispora tengchongensis TaxID=1073253 RepID=A0A840P7S9_9ACTN|nr:SpoIIE family protein phosphatase [Thermocatellispora tengchongensis]MBB5135728.1 PAS domain-containing protein/anti-sigma regulatory factor (Ser/Thr protein kinase) [Thermocatellispora tengchongensis]
MRGVRDWAARRLRPALPPASPSSAGLSGFQEAGAGFWSWNLVTGEVTLDPVACSVLGIGPEGHDGRMDTWLARLHPDDLGRVPAVRDAAIQAHDAFSVEYRVCRPDGTFRWARECGHVALGEDGRPARVAGALWDTTEIPCGREPMDRALLRMRDGFLVLDADLRVTFANAEAERLLGARGALLGRRPSQVLPGVVAQDLERSCRRAAAEGAPVDLDVEWPGDRRWYHLRLGPVNGEVTVYITDFTAKRLDAQQRAAAEQAAAERTARIQELTTALAEALTTRDVVEAVAEHVMQPFNAAGLVVADIRPGERQIAGAVGYPAEFMNAIGGEKMLRHGPIGDIVRSRTPLCIGSVEEYVRRYPHLADVPAAGGKQAWAFLPLIASGHVIGCCLISFARPRHFTGEERGLLLAISGLVGQALERARLYDAERARARELQRALLPRVLPALPGIAAAARYLPVGKDMEVGGDWYDVIPLSADRVALVIGDVMGHGISEAATMGRLRTAVHTLADLELPPDELLAHLNDLVIGLGDDFYATCLYLIYDPADRACTFASAGHPPPAVVHPGGTVIFPGTDPDPPLGAATPPFAATELTLPEDTLLVLYTDGLVESAGPDIDEGLAELGRTLSAACAGRDLRRRRHDQPLLAEAAPAPAPGDGEGDGPLHVLCDSLIATLLPAHQATTDDAALLIARTRALRAEDIACWALPEDPVAAGEARKHVREQLSAWNLDALSMTTELLASELVGNVIRHARGPITLRLIRGRVLTCEVSDGSLTTPRVRRSSETDEGGRGLQLVTALAQRWGTRFTPEGKSIWTEQPLPDSPL